MNDLLIQAIGFIAVVFFIVSYQVRSNRHLFLYQLVGCLIFTAQLLILGAYTGAFSLMINILRNLLLLKINALINRYRGLLVKNGLIVIDEFEIEPAKRRVTANKKEIALAPKEYDLLMYLIENKDIILSRTQILDNLWADEFDCYERVVDTHIKKLRAALGDYGYHIDTVIKAGYRWVSGKAL